MGSAPFTLDDWLTHAERVHAVGIDMGLERIGRVAARLDFAAPAHRCAPRIVIVAGTNGKGSTCIALEALLTAAGLEVGTTLSPHVHRFNERVRIGGVEADDATLCTAFAAVEAARGDVPLTYFEFSALVALYCFRAAAVDVAILEIGLGGRLDAFNLVSADLAIVTSIGLDHQSFLGDDVEGIGREKAGVMRPGQTVVLGAEVTGSVREAGRTLGCDMAELGVDFTVEEAAETWSFRGRVTFEGLTRRALAPHNCALAIEAARRLGALDGLDAPQVDAALGRTGLPGRCERWRIGGSPSAEVILDVAHNPSGAAFLRRTLERVYPGRRYVVVSAMLDDKDAAGVAAALGPLVRFWVCLPTTGRRALSGTALAERLGAGDLAVAVADAGEGLRRALSLVADSRGDAILGMGSFSVVEQLRNLLTGPQWQGQPQDDGWRPLQSEAANAAMDLKP